MRLDNELLAIFIEECQELLEEAENIVMRLEESIEDEDLLESLLTKLFRVAHNIKGSSGAMGLMELSKFVHKYEDTITALQKKKIKLNQLTITYFLQSTDLIKEYMESVSKDPDIKFDFSLQTEKLVKLLANEPISIEAEQSLQQSIDKTVDLLPNTKTSDLQFHQGTIDSNDKGESKKKVANSTLELVPQESIKVSLDKLDGIINSLGELVIYQNMLDEEKGKTLIHAEFEKMNKLINIVSNVTKDLQYSCVALRMIPLNKTFKKLKRIIRELSSKLGKKINFFVEGEDIELDKLIVDALSDPLTHLVRNSIDHGIEDIDTRVSAGKNEYAQIKIKATIEAGIAKIVISDDGGGLNKERIISKAKENNLISNNVNNLNDSEIFQLIMQPGFSTKKEITNVSGRGVGMDIVKSTISRLNGKIDIASVPGKGTSFTINLPLSLSLIEGMLVLCDKRRFIIPLSHLIETIEIEEKQLGILNHQTTVLHLRGEEIPLFNLNQMLHQKHNQEDRTTPSAPFGLIIKYEENKFAFRVDEIVGKQTIVVKDIGREINLHSFFSGAAILGDGNPGLILDLAALIHGVHKINNRNEGICA